MEGEGGGYAANWMSNTGQPENKKIGQMLMIINVLIKLFHKKSEKNENK